MRVSANHATIVPSNSPETASLFVGAATDNTAVRCSAMVLTALRSVHGRRCTFASASPTKIMDPSAHIEQTTHSVCATMRIVRSAPRERSSEQQRAGSFSSQLGLNSPLAACRLSYKRDSAFAYSTIANAETVLPAIQTS